MKRTHLGKRLKAARVMKELTQEEAAEKLGVSRRTYINWENKVFNMKHKDEMAIVKVLGIPNNEIILLRLRDQKEQEAE